MSSNTLGHLKWELYQKTFFFWNLLYNELVHLFLIVLLLWCWFLVVLAILLTGGDDTLTSAEVLFTNGSSICELPQLSQSKSEHTQSGLTACGGWGSDTRRNCIKFEAGSWITLTDNLVEEHDIHSSWVSPDGDIHLIGGSGSLTTTEIVNQNGTSIRSFDLKYDTR